MSLNEKRTAYQNFFLKNEAGKDFLTKIYELIDQNHRKAEKHPEQARDYVQRAMGEREIIEHIQSLTAERGKVTE